MALDPLTAGLDFGGKLLGVVDDLFTSDEERMEARRRLSGQQGQQILSEMGERVKVIVAESQGSWLARSWRPITMLTFVALIVLWWCGFTPERASEDLMKELFELIKIGLGGYVVGRSAEKVATIVQNK